MQPPQPASEVQPVPAVVEGSTELERPTAPVAEQVTSAAPDATPPVASHNVSDDPASVVPASDAPVVPETITSPLSAGDSDLIEPQWVDAVDTIVAQDAQDPHKEETDAEKLSQTYLKQRFNIDVNNAS